MIMSNDTDRAISELKGQIIPCDIPNIIPAGPGYFGEANNACAGIAGAALTALSPPRKKPNNT